MSDLISRQDAIDAVTRAIWHYPNESYKNLNVYEVTEALVSDAIKSLPSAEPQTVFIDGVGHFPKISATSQSLTKPNKSCEDDLISRQEAVKQFCGHCKGQNEPCEHRQSCKTMKVLKSLPSAKPKTGHAETASSGVTVWAVCSECKKPIDLWDNYCRSCGARMNGGEEE